MSGINAFRIGLYIAPDGTMTESLFTLMAVATNSAVTPGRFGYPGLIYEIPGNFATPIAYQVKAWSLFAGASYEAAVASGVGITGKSPIGRAVPGIAGAPVTPLFSFNTGVPDFPGQLASGIVIGVPEPGTLALIALGGAILGTALRSRS